MARSVPYIRILRLAALLAAVCLSSPAQDPAVKSNPGDWEQINFETDSAVITDGFPGLKRLAALMKSNARYSVTIVGFTDDTGTLPHNQKLGAERAAAVGMYLVKYGAAPGQIHSSSGATSQPEIPPAGAPPYNVKEARWINRRVQLT